MQFLYLISYSSFTCFHRKASVNHTASNRLTTSSYFKWPRPHYHKCDYIINNSHPIIYKKSCAVHKEFSRKKSDHLLIVWAYYSYYLKRDTPRIFTFIQLYTRLAVLITIFSTNKPTHLFHTVDIIQLIISNEAHQRHILLSRLE